MTVMSSVVAVRSVGPVLTPATSNISHRQLTVSSMTTSCYSPVSTLMPVFVVSETTVIYVTVGSVSVVRVMTFGCAVVLSRVMCSLIQMMRFGSVSLVPTPLLLVAGPFIMAPRRVRAVLLMLSTVLRATVVRAMSRVAGMTVSCVSFSQPVLVASVMT